MSWITRSSGRAAGALAIGVAALSAFAGCTRPQAPASGQSLSWALRVGPQLGDQPIVCASDKQPPCVITRGMGEQRIQSTLIIGLPGAADHRFAGEVFVGFVGDDIGPAAHALRVDQSTTQGTSAEITAIGLVTVKPGTYPIRIRLDETGADLATARQHAIDVMVEVR